MSTRYHSIGRVGPGWPGRSDMPIPHPACSSENADEPRSPTTPRVEAFWPDGAGMPDPSRKRPPTKPVPEPSMLGRGLMHGRVRWLSRLPLRVWWHATVSIVPLVQGQGRPPGQASARCANKDSGPQGDPSCLPSFGVHSTWHSGPCHFGQVVCPGRTRLRVPPGEVVPIGAPLAAEMQGSGSDL